MQHGNLTEQERDEIEAFVRGTLGCQCPTEVFESILVESQAGQEGEPRHTRLLIGQQLLIFVAGASQADRTAPAVAALARAGTAERNDEGYNRFRLVQPAPASEAVQQAFRAVIDGDNKAHLHFVPAGDIPEPLRVPDH